MLMLLCVPDTNLDVEVVCMSCHNMSATIQWGFEDTLTGNIATDC
jgi:hypothetical protein